MLRIRHDLVPTFSPDDIWKTERAGQAPRPALIDIAENLLPRARELIAPQAILDRFSVEKVTHDRVYLSGGQALRGVDISRILAPAVSVFVCLVTIGDALEARAEEYFQCDESLEGYLLDCYGTAAVSSLVPQVCARLEPIAADEGLRLGFPISPGDPGWPLSEQRVLFRLLPAESIGIRLTESCAMLPKKSISFVVGLGAEVLTPEQGSQCDYCSLRETCRHRSLIETNP